MIYKVQGNDSTPFILLDNKKGEFEISGKSVPEDSLAIFGPVLDHITEYVQQPQPSTVLNVKLIYFNTSTSKFLLDIMSALEDLVDRPNVEVAINWYYQVDDEDMMEIGEDFKDLLVVPIHVIAY